MTADHPPRFGDFLEILPCSSEIRRYVVILMEHAANEACVHPGCPECRMLAKIYELVQARIFHTNQYPVSVRDRKASAETAMSIGEEARTPRGFRYSSVCATVVAEASAMASKVAASKPIQQTLPLEEQVRQRAHELYIQRGGESGSEVDDWLQAEQEILMAKEQQRDSS
jgi:hypothetical protein